MKIITLHTFDTEYSADCIEWCPHENFTAYFVCGTYQLKEAHQNNDCVRDGRIYLFKFECATETLTEMQRIDTSAILDMKWLPIVSQQPKLAAATALGEILILSLEEEKLRLMQQATFKVTPACLALSLDVQIEAPSASCCKILMSDSLGNMHLYNYNSEQIIQVHTWSAHDFEAWICAFDNWQPAHIYSGGDDCLLKGFDTRTYERIFINKSHTAGVTCLLSHRKNEYQLLTGSYDNHVRTFDTRSMRTPLHELNLNGGIWRLKSHPQAMQLLLVACMYNNFHIVKLTTDGKLQHKTEYNEHESISYGADWCPDIQVGNEKYYMATCSFYDHKMCVASVDTK